MRHVAMDEIVTCALLTSAAAALVLEIVALGGADRLRIDAFGEARHERWCLVEPLSEARGLHPGLPSPPDGAAMDVVHVQHFRPAMDHALFDGIAEIAPGDRSAWITEDVRAVGLRLVEAARESLLQGEPIHERLAAVIDGARTRAVAGGERIDLGHRRAGAIEETVPLVANLVVDDHELAEMAAVRRHDGGLPAGAKLTALQIQVTRAFRLHDHGAEEPMGRLHACGAMTVEVVRALGLLLPDPPLVGHAASGANP